MTLLEEKINVDEETLQRVKENVDRYIETKGEVSIWAPDFTPLEDIYSWFNTPHKPKKIQIKRLKTDRNDSYCSLFSSVVGDTGIYLAILLKYYPKNSYLKKLKKYNPLYWLEYLSVKSIQKQYPKPLEYLIKALAVQEADTSQNHPDLEKRKDWNYYYQPSYRNFLAIKSYFALNDYQKINGKKIPFPEEIEKEMERIPIELRFKKTD